MVFQGSSSTPPPVKLMLFATFATPSDIIAREWLQLRASRSPQTFKLSIHIQALDRDTQLLSHTPPAVVEHYPRTPGNRPPQPGLPPKGSTLLTSKGTFVFGRFSLEEFGRSLPAPHQINKVYLCGPPGMQLGVAETLSALGIRWERM